jgi:hypothetical protein
MASPDDRGNQFEEELVNARQHEVIMSILDQLDEREKSIIMHRYGLARSSASRRSASARSNRGRCTKCRKSPTRRSWISRVFDGDLSD